MRSALIAAAVTGLAAAAPAPETALDPALDVYLKPQTLAVLPDGRHYNLFCLGHNGPTILLDAGASSWSTSWHKLQPDMAKTTRVCAIDRPGFNFSDPGPLPRDVAAEAADLHAALQAAGLRPPYILVGHSYAGMTTRMFAYAHPNEVAGLLLLDPGFEHWTHRMGQQDITAQVVEAKRKCLDLAREGKVVEGGPCLGHPSAILSEAMRRRQIVALSQPGYFEAMMSEIANKEGRSSDELDAARRKLGDIPLIVLTEDKARWVPSLAEDGFTAADAERQYDILVATHQDIARDSTRGVERIVAGASHDVGRDKPDVVLSAVHEIIAAVRASGGVTATRR